jgi:WD40 repeat protein
MEGAGRSKVFISYSRADLGFADELVAALGLSAEFEILFDRIGIGHGEEWRGRLGRLIVESDTVVFILSPDSVASEVCAWEIDEARRLSKRIIPVLWRAVDFAKVPAGLSAINAVPFDGERAVSGLPKLITALNSDLAWLREHTRLGERAADWEGSGRASAYLLRGAALGAARDWLAARPANAPETTESQRVFIQASEEEESRLLGEDRKRLEELEKAKAIAEAERDSAETAREREAAASRRVVRATTAGFVVALILFAAASVAGWFAYRNAEDERAQAVRADQAARRAEQEATRAASAAADAEAQRDAALLIQSRFLARAAQQSLALGDAANAIGLARAALPKDLSDPEDRPFAIEPAQAIFDAYGHLRELATLRGHGFGVVGALPLPGERVVTWGRDGTIRWWRLDGTPLKTVLAHDHPTAPGTSEDTGVHGVLRLDDGRLLSWGVDKTAKLWSDGGDLIGGFLKEESWIHLERLRDGRVAARIGSEYRVWSAGLEPIVTLRGPLEWMTGATLLNDGRFLTWQQGTAGGNSSTVHTAMLWSPDGTPGPVLEGHARRIRGGFALTDGRIATWDNGGGLRFWSADGRPETVVESVHRHVRDVFPLSDGRVFTWGQEAYHDNVWWARIWNARGESVPLIEASGPPLKGIELDDGRLLLGINSRSPTIWSTDGTRGPALRGHEKPAYNAEQWPDGRIVTYGADRTARVWSGDGTPLLVLRGHEGSVGGVKPLPGNRFLSWSFWDRTARIWSAEPRPRGELRLPGGNAQEVKQLSGGLIAVHANDGGIGLHDAGLERKLTLRNDARDIAGLIELSDGRLLTQGSWASNRESGPALRMWSAAGEAIGDLAGSDAEFMDVAETPSGRILAFDPSGRVWSWRADGQLEQTRREAETERFFRVFPLADGRYVTLGDKNRLQLWSAEGEPGIVLVEDSPRPPRYIIPLSDGRLLTLGLPADLWIWEKNGDPGPPIQLEKENLIVAAVPLTTGGILLNLGDGTIVVVNSDGSLGERPFPSGPDGRYRHHKFIELSDGRLLVSTSGRGTRLWSADGEPGPRILDEEIGGATLLSDGNFLVWPKDRSDLRIVGGDGRLGPVLRGHRSEILNAFQLADGRILSWGEDSAIRVWPGSVDQAVGWADDVIERLQPLTLAERCTHYLEPSGPCADVDTD